MKAFKAKRLDEALEAFRASYDIVASPNTRLMVVHVLEDLGDVVAAYWEAVATRKAADAAAAQSRRYKAAAKSARQELARLRARVGLVTVTVLSAEDGDSAADEELELTVGGKVIDRAVWGEPIAVAPGQCEVALVASAGTATKEIGVAAGGAIEITIAPRGQGPDPDGDPDQPPRQPGDPVRPPGGGDGTDGGGTDGAGDDGSGVRTTAYVFGGLGVAGMVIFAVAGSMAQSNYDELVDQCPADRCPADLEDQADTTSTQQTVANVGLIAGVAGLGIGLGLLVTSFAIADSPGEAEVSLAVGPGTLTVSGSF